MKQFAEGSNLSDLVDESVTDPEELAWDHALDLSASVHRRLAELEWSQKELANRLGVTQGRVSQILKGAPGLSLKLLARIECALGLDFRPAFIYQGNGNSVSAEFDSGASASLCLDSMDEKTRGSLISHWNTSSSGIDFSRASINTLDLAILEGRRAA